MAKGSYKKQQADAEFSRYIRKSHADDNGYVSCVTCGKTEHWKDVDAGHFVSRYHNATRFYERNVHPQCKVCNRFRNGSLDEYALFLINHYGLDILNELNRKKHEVMKLSPKDYQAIRYEYKEKADSIQLPE